MQNLKCKIQNVVEGIILISFIFLLVLFSPVRGLSSEKNDFQFKKQPEIQRIKPPKPVKVKLHRTAKGEYTWELNGDDVDEIIQADRKLRKSLKLE